jgi:1,4-dihydroxy-2-naphthoate octaprenyltransferase
VRAWVLAARPRTLTASVVPVAVGTACAHAVGKLKWDAAFAALLGALAIQIGTNFANDVFDAEKGADAADRVGPLRAVQAGLLDGRAIRVGMAIAFGVAVLSGVYLTAVAGWPIVAIGIASILSGIAYTGGPYPLGYHGLGDVFVLLFFGPVAVCGTAFAQVGTVPELAWWASVPVGSLATAILVVNNLRDRHTDARAGKRTLAVRFGRRGAEIEYGLLLIAAYAVPIALAWRGLLGFPVLLPLVTLPWAVALFVEVRTREGAPLNATLARTANLLLAFGSSFAAGIAAAQAGTG